MTEAGSSPGGVIETSVTSDGFLCEGGPNSAQPTPALLQTAVRLVQHADVGCTCRRLTHACALLQRECGLGNELVFGDPKAPRFVLWKGKLRPVPTGPGSLLTSDLLSTRGKLRAALGALGVRDKPPGEASISHRSGAEAGKTCTATVSRALALFSAPAECAELPKAPQALQRQPSTSAGHEESVEQFVRRNLGAEVFERLVEPFCSGVYAGDPAKLSIEAAFGKVRRSEHVGWWHKPTGCKAVGQ